MIDAADDIPIAATISRAAALNPHPLVKMSPRMSTADSRRGRQSVSKTATAISLPENRSDGLAIVESCSAVVADTLAAQPRKFLNFGREISGRLFMRSWQSAPVDIGLLGTKQRPPALAIVSLGNGWVCGDGGHGFPNGSSLRAALDGLFLHGLTDDMAAFFQFLGSAPFARRLAGQHHKNESLQYT